jgi:hypothetical protein
MSMSMKNLLTIALTLFIGSVSAQSPCYVFWPGEYQNGMTDTCNHRFGTAAIGGAVGNSSPGTNGKPGLLTPGQITGGGVMDTVSAGSSCLHSQLAIKHGLLYGTGINDNHSLGLGPAAGNQSQFTLVTQDSMGHAFTNVVGVWSFANSYGSGTLAWKGGAQGDTLWAAGLLEGGIRGNGSNPTTDNGYFVPITGFDAGDTIIDAKADAILIVLTKNGTGVRKVYTSGNSSSFTGNGTSDLTLHKLTLSFTPMIIDVGVFWAHIIGTDGNDYAWGWYQQIWGGTLGSSPTTPTNIMTNIGMTAGSIAAFSQGDISSYYITTTGKLYGLGNDICSGLGILPKIHWNTYSSNNPLYGTPATPWAWNQNQLEAPPLWRVTTAALLDSCNLYISVNAGHTFGAYTMAEDIYHIIRSLGRNKDGPQANGVYDQQYVNGNPQAQYPNSYDSASRDHEGWFMDFPWNDAGGVARHSPYCDTVPTATFCSLYTTESEGPPTISGFNNVSITTSSYTYSGITISGQGGHSVNNIRMTERTVSGCPTSLNSTPYAATTTFSGLSPGVHTIQLVATDDQYKQSTATATITVSSSSQTRFYVSSSTGNDGNGCTVSSYCATPAHAIGLMTSGDTLSLKAGDTWNTTLYPISGIVIDTFGTGADPKFDGSYTASGWVSLGNGIYETYIPNDRATLNCVTLDGNLQGMGRYPDSGYAIYSGLTSSTLTSSAITSFPYNFNGGTVAIRDEFYVIDTVHISAVGSNTFTLATSPSVIGGRGDGFFVMNHPSTLLTTTRIGSWYNKVAVDSLQVYFGGGGPGGHTVKIAVLDTGIYLTRVNNVVVQQLDFEYFNQYSVFQNNTNTILLDSCRFQYAGNNIVKGNNDTASSFRYDTMRYANNNFAYNTGNSPYLKLLYSYGDSAGMIAGMGQSGTSHTYEGWSWGNEFGQIIQFNTFLNTGYNGMYYSGDSCKIFNNDFLNYCMVKCDGGGVYSWNGSLPTYIYGDSVAYNLCLNSGSPGSGIVYDQTDIAFGFYQDNYATKTTFYLNTGAFNTSGGGFVHGASNSFINNDWFGNGYAQFMASEVASHALTGLVYTGNIHGYTGSALSIAFSTPNNDLSSFCSSCDNNYYLNPNGIVASLWTKSSVDAGTSRSLANWQSNTGYDTHSSYQNGTLLFYSSVPSVRITLGLNGKDAYGNIYPGILNLGAYSSKTIIQLPCSCVNISYFPKIL